MLCYVQHEYQILTGEAFSTCTAVLVFTRDIVDEEVIDVDELDKGNISLISSSTSMKTRNDDKLRLKLCQAQDQLKLS